jgi:hypothetical protein
MTGGFYVEGKAQKLSLKSLEDRLAQLEARLDAVKAQTDRLAGSLPQSGSAVADWQLVESDVVAVGMAGTVYKVHSVIVFIQNLVGVITIRMYVRKDGDDIRVYTETFDAAAVPPGLWVVNGTLAIDDALRVTAESNNPADNGKAVEYKCLLEEMMQWK